MAVDLMRVAMVEQAVVVVVHLKVLAIVLLLVLLT